MQSIVQPADRVTAGDWLLTASYSVVGQFGDQAAVLDANRESDHLGVGAVDANALGILESPAVVGAHEDAAPINHFTGLVGADVGEQLVNALPALNQEVGPVPHLYRRGQLGKIGLQS